MIQRTHAQSLWSPYPFHEPVEYGAEINGSEGACFEPSEAELEAFCLQAAGTVARMESGRDQCILPPGSTRGYTHKVLYFPARFTECENLSPTCRALLENFYAEQSHHVNSTISGINPDGMQSLQSRHRLDFSQCRLNPYFGALFDSRLKTPSGRVEITLRKNVPVESALLRDLATADVVSTLRSMFLTQPPCTSVGIYRNAYTSIHVSDYAHLAESTGKELVVRLNDADGIKLGQVIDALLQHASGLLEAWVERAKDLSDMVLTRHWQEDMWRVPGAPTFILMLDNTAMGQDWISEGEHYARIREHI